MSRAAPLDALIAVAAYSWRAGETRRSLFFGVHIFFNVFFAYLIGFYDDFFVIHL